jgi:hypothetical protein
VIDTPAIPPAQAALPNLGSGPGNAVLAVVSKAEAQVLAKLGPGTQLAAQVVPSDAKGVVQILTQAGDSLTLKLPPNLLLPPGADLTLQLVTQNGLPALKLLAINGQPPGLLGALSPQMGGLPGLNPGALLQPGQTQAGPVNPGPQTPRDTMAAGAPAQPTPPAGPLGISATVIKPAMAGAVMAPLAPDGTPQSAPPGLADLTPGTRLTVRVASIALPGTAAVPPLMPALAQPTSQPQPGQPSPQQAVPQAPAQAVQTTVQAQAVIANPVPAAGQTPQASLQPQSQTQPLPAAPPLPATPAPSLEAAPQTLPGLVISHSHGGNSVIQTPAGLLSINSGPPMPEGSQIKLEVVGPPQPPPPTSEAAAPRPLGPGGDGWPTLNAVADTLAQSDPQAAAQLIRMIPQANARLAANLSLFAGALRSGDIKAIANEPLTKALDKAGRRDLADRLKKDFMGLVEDAARPLGNAGQWQGMTLPFAHGADIDPIRLYVQRQAADEEKKKGGGGSEQRFIVEVSMSRLGRIQFDGLVVKDAKRFDLIVRTLEPLPPQMRNDIAGIFAECGQLTGVVGTVGFQSGRVFIDLPPADAASTQIVV